MEHIDRRPYDDDDGLSDALAQTIDLRRLDRQRIDAADDDTRPAVLECRGRHLQRAQPRPARLDAADDAHHGQSERRIHLHRRGARAKDLVSPQARVARC